VKTDLFDSWLAMEEPTLTALAADVPALAGISWGPDALPVLEAAALELLPPPDAELDTDAEEAARVLWQRLLRGIGRCYTEALGAVWVCAPLLQPTGGSRLVPVLDVPGLPVWIEVGELLDRALVERTGTVLADAYELAGQG
jgi:hypothetical protein